MKIQEAIEVMEASAARKEKLRKDNSAILRRIEVAKGLQAKGNSINYKGVHRFVITPEEREFIDMYEIIESNP
jgi:hypothetical protein